MDRAPRRGRLHFTDFQYDGNGDAAGVRYRIRMDTARGAAHKGALLTIESPFAPGQRVNFTGQISYRVGDQAEADAIQSYIITGLRWSTNFGGERTAGFGRLVDVAIVREDRMSLQVAPGTVSTSAEEGLGIAIRPLAPFCVAKRQVNPNLFESDIVLSGGVLRGALATTLKSLCGLPRDAIIDGSLPPPWQEIGTYFNHIRFTHAFPALEHANQRPVVEPFSLVKDRGNLYDVALCEGPCLLGDPPRAPSFAIDWKTSDDVRALFGWAHPKRELRVRTAMDRERRRARDEQLFAYDMVVPQGCLWYGKVDLSQVPAGVTRAAVALQLRVLLRHGLRGLGKTKAAAEVMVDGQAAPAHPSDPHPIGNLWIVTLQTPALLCDPKNLNEASGAQDLFAAYNAVWDDISGGTMRLIRFFASQSLAGGYLVLRFQPDKPYNPLLLTNQGSVFVLQASGGIESAQAVIEAWLNHGLPLPHWARDRYGEHWSTCPFLPADGFGEIAVNLPCHTHQQPPKEVFHGV
jgi:hypothetical protein